MTTDSSNIVSLRPKSGKPLPLKGSEKKWTRPVMDYGFTIVPTAIFEAQQRLGLNSTQFAIVLQLASYWWEADERPWPSKKSLGERLDLSPRQVQRHIAALEKAGLVKRIERRRPGKGKTSNEYDLTGLVEKLGVIVEDFRLAEQEATKKKTAARKRGARFRKE
jgi:DNA-binding transcriptional ArsR family regulator